MNTSCNSVPVLTLSTTLLMKDCVCMYIHIYSATIIFLQSEARISYGSEGYVLFVVAVVFQLQL